MASSRTTRVGKARTLLLPGIVQGAGGIWADLGCGDGIFTAALAALLGPGAEIYGVDTSQAALRSLMSNLSRDVPGAVVHAVQADFAQSLDLPPLDGVLMANSLHFVQSKQEVLAGIIDVLKPGGHLVVVEYNTRQGNRWVPYPLDNRGFLALARTLGLCGARLLTKIPSTFLGEMYSAMGAAPEKTRSTSDS
jgi:ubiquinone/menaquinone biosynthesis C-methylase UbiE